MAVDPARPPDDRRRRAGGAAEALRAPRRRIYWGYWIVGAAFLSQFIVVGAQAQVSGVFLPPMTDELGWSYADYTWAQVIGRFIMAFVGFFIGVYVDRYGGRMMMVIGVTILAGALFATSFVTELWQWLLIKGLFFTVGAALMGNLVVNVTLSKWFVEKRGRVIGFSSMGVSFAGIVMPPLMTLIVEEWGWRTGWRALAILALALIYPASMVMRRQPEDYGWHPDGRSDEESRGAGGDAARRDFANSFTRREALRTRALYIVIIAFGLGGIGIGTMMLHTIPFVQDAGFGATTAALMMTTQSIPALLSKPLWGVLMDRWDPRLLAAGGFALSGTAIVLIALSAAAGSLPLLVLSFLLMGAGFGGQIPLQETIWASFFGRRYLGSVRSVAMPFSLALGAFAPLVVSFYFDRVGNYDNAFFAIGGLWAVAALLMLTLKRPVKPPAPDAPVPVEPPEPYLVSPAAAAEAPLVAPLPSSNGTGEGEALPPHPRVDPRR